MSQQVSLKRAVWALTYSLALRGFCAVVSEDSALNTEPEGELRGDPQTEYLIDIWGTDDGLPSSTVTGIAQSPDGYLWCSTYDGVVRFDGVRFVRIGPDDPAKPEANRVLCLLADKRGDLWLGSDGAGLWRYAAEKFTVFAEPGSTALNAVRAVAEGSDGNLWLGTQGGLGRLKDGALEWFTTANGFSNAVFSVWNIAFDKGGRLWCADWTSLKAFNDGQFETPSLTPPPRVPVRAVYADAAGNMWAGMMGHAWRLGSDGQWKSLPQVGQFTRQEVTAFCQTRAGHLWVGTRRGLFHWGEGRWMSVSGRNGVSVSEVRTIFEDAEGNLWVGTGTAGLARLKRRVVTTFGASNGVSDGPVFALCEKPDGGVCVGLNDGRIVHASSKDSAMQFEPFSAARDLPRDAPVKTILNTRDGALWVGTFGNGLMRFQNGQKTQFAPSSGSPARIDKINALLEDTDGNVWIGSYYSLYRATGSNIVTPVPIDGRELRAPVIALLQDRAGAIWVGWEGLGIARLTGNDVMWLTRREGLPSHFIRSLYEDKGGALWIGTAAGLCRWSNGKLTTFTKAHGLVDDAIMQILEDDADNLWLGSNNGIMRVAKQELAEVAEGRKNLLELFACGVGEGMVSPRCSGGLSPAGLKTADGKLWFPTTEGLVMIDPVHLKQTINPRPPPVYVEEVRANGQLAASSPGSLLNFTPGTHRLEFVYTALNLTAPERVRFKYRLDGFDSDWTEAGTGRSAVYPKLSHGRYQFQVIACNNDGVWNSAGHRISFRIAAPFWQTWWFLAIGGITAAGLLGAGVRLVSVRHLRRKLRRLEEAHAIEKERMRIAQDMHDEIGGKLSRISFLSDLARRSIPQVVEGNGNSAQPTDGTDPARQIEEVSEAAREVIRTVDEIVWAVSPRNDTLESLVHYICRHAEEFFELIPVELEFELPSEFPVCKVSADIRHNLFCAIKEALNNVLKHSGATRVRIEFAIKGAVLEVRVVDNGVGFLRDEVLGRFKGAGMPSLFNGRDGNGLLNMQERMESVHGSCSVSAEPGKGTRAVFTAILK